jgi:hypothetical protein
MKNKKFDCVKMMRDIRNQIYQETKNLSGEEFIEKLKKEFPELHKKQKTAV